MDLESFVTETLTGIQRGVREAIRELDGETGIGVINPVFQGMAGISNAERQHVEFDIAVTVSEGTSGRAGGGLRIHVLEAGGETSEESAQSHVTRIKFSVPIIPPPTEVT